MRAQHLDETTTPLVTKSCDERSLGLLKDLAMYLRNVDTAQTTRIQVRMLIILAVSRVSMLEVACISSQSHSGPIRTTSITHPYGPLNL